MGIIEDELAVLDMKMWYFRKLKEGDKVKVPVRGRIRNVTVHKKYEHYFVAILPNEQKECFTIGDVVTCMYVQLGTRVGDAYRIGQAMIAK